MSIFPNRRKIERKPEQGDGSSAEVEVKRAEPEIADKASIAQLSTSAKRVFSAIHEAAKAGPRARDPFLGYYTRFDEDRSTAVLVPGHDVALRNTLELSVVDGIWQIADYFPPTSARPKADEKTPRTTVRTTRYCEVGRAGLSETLQVGKDGKLIEDAASPRKEIDATTGEYATSVENWLNDIANDYEGSTRQRLNRDLGRMAVQEDYLDHLIAT